MIGVGRLTPHDDPTAGFGVDLGVPREGKSPSERIFGGVEDFLGRLEEDEGSERGSGCVSASNWRCWAGDNFERSEPLTTGLSTTE